jgi:hypothetical protein
MKTYTKKELTEELGIKDTTLRETLRACGFDTKRQEYPKDEIDNILRPARELLNNGNLRTLQEMSEWAKKKRRELYGDDEEMPDESAYSYGEEDEIDAIFEEIILQETERRMLRMFRKNMASIPELYMKAARTLYSSGEMKATFDRLEERRNELFRKEMRDEIRARRGLPYYKNDNDDVIDTDADVIDDSDDDSHLSP